MTVIVRKKAIFGNNEVDIKSYMPPGVVSKQDRLQADKLDEYLTINIPKKASEIEAELKSNTNVVKRWHLLGKFLVELAKKTDLVKQADIDDLLLWQAVWYFLPETMIPEGTNRDIPYAEKQHKRHDHLSMCYELGKCEWREISWLQRWSDWKDITSRPALLRDKRILKALGIEIAQMTDYPSQEVLQTILKKIAAKFPTKQFRDSSKIGDLEIIESVRDAVESTVQ